jgi:uncharacterized protein YndB with AHSA1/START domain
MKTKTLHQTVTFSASPRQVYEMLMNSKKHRSLSGEPAKISRKVGGKFTAWGSHISGINLALKPGQKIVQAWRATGWWPDHYSIAIFEIAKARGGSKLKFTQIGIPPNRYSGHYLAARGPAGQPESSMLFCGALRLIEKPNSLASFFEQISGTGLAIGKCAGISIH